ncbi:hypothetical protein PHIN3_340 [Sinorhizobium phage phiN3]|uniref:Uncharacterized protein n=1 Tax=Sinorhizobium phage phiN3 TaxID=1647405 RepID=A0A0F6SJ53_9CAUD|nr:hypothetical protein AVT40_gp193 [Sinorhizobium phage phiN3]AKF13603.1 hypothetical protein PHIN3_340 [Sinorhizobium phage phiN3]
MNRKEMIEAICEVSSLEFQTEIGHFMGIDEREYDYDQVSALFDAMNMEGQTRHVVTIARSLLIQFGFYRPMPQDEIENTYVSGGRVPWFFKLNGIRYTSDETDEEWFDPAFDPENRKED